MWHRSATLHRRLPLKSSCLFVAELREAFKLHDYDMDGKIFEADVGSCIRSVPGLKPSQHEIDEIKAYMDRGGTSDATSNIFKSHTGGQSFHYEEYPTDTQWGNLTQEP